MLRVISDNNEKHMDFHFLSRVVIKKEENSQFGTVPNCVLTSPDYQQSSIDSDNLNWKQERKDFEMEDKENMQVQGN